MGLKIDDVAIACYWKHLPLLRTCVASVRFWNPDVPIVLLKDSRRRPFPTGEIERHFNATSVEVPQHLSGWGWSKIWPVLRPHRQRTLVLDADTVFLGPVIEMLEKLDDDFIVTGVRDDNPEAMLVVRDYFDINAVRRFDSGFHYPGFAFNTGQMVVTSGILDQKDFERVMTFSPGPENKFPEALRYTDQGILNYVVMRAAQDGRASMRYENFWKWPASPESRDIRISDLASHNGTPHVMHWAGIKTTRPDKFDRHDILSFYEEWYYSQLPRGRALMRARRLMRSALTFARVARQGAYHAFGRQPPKRL